MVRKEDMSDQWFQLFIKVSTFDKWENFLMSICRGRFEQEGKWNFFENSEPDLLFNLTKLNGAKIQTSLSMFDGFMNNDENIRKEMLDFTFPLQTFVIRAQLSENQEKKFFIDQHAASGVLSKSMEEAYDKVFPNNRYTHII